MKKPTMEEFNSLPLVERKRQIEAAAQFHEGAAQFHEGVAQSFREQCAQMERASQSPSGKIN